MRRRGAVLLGLLTLTGLPSLAYAQEDTCTLLPGARFFSRTATGNGRATSYISGPAHFTCTGGITVKADSAVWTSGLERERIELLGDVFYQDSVKTLTADRLIYQRTLDRLYAYGDVVLTDSAGNAVIRGPALEHRGVRAGAVERARTIVTGGAHARIWPADSSAAPGAAGAPGESPVFDDDRGPGTPPATGEPGDSTRGSPLDVDADRIEIIGRDQFHALGDVVMMRDSIRGYAEEARFRRESGRLVLIDSARVVGSEYDLSADRIEATLVDQTLDDVVAMGHAELVSGDTDANAHRIHIFVEEGEVQRMVAWHGDSASVDLRASVRTPDVRLMGDSIQVLAPGGALERVTAVGRAYAERLPGDSALAPAPTSAPATTTPPPTPPPPDKTPLPDIVTRDWVQGDTIVGYFVEAAAATDSASSSGDPAVAPDSTPAVNGDTFAEPRVELRRIVAIGGSAPARSIYRMRSAEDSADRPQINYVVANRITILLEHGGIVALEAEGPVRGIQLQPGSGPADGGSGPASSTTLTTSPAAGGSIADNGSSER